MSHGVGFRTGAIIAVAVIRLATTTPVIDNPSLDPTSEDLLAVSYKSGYGARSIVNLNAMQCNVAVIDCWVPPESTSST